MERAPGIFLRVSLPILSALLFVTNAEISDSKSGSGPTLRLDVLSAERDLYKYLGLYSNCSSSMVVLAEREMYSLISSLSPFKHTCRQSFEAQDSLILTLNCSQIELYSVCDYESFTVLVDGATTKLCSERMPQASWHGASIAVNYTRTYFGVRGGYICTIMARSASPLKIFPSTNSSNEGTTENDNPWRNFTSTTPSGEPSMVNISGSDMCGCGLSVSNVGDERAMHPWYSVLIVEEAKNRTRVCGATLVSGSHLVTAAECLLGNIVKIDVGLGKYNLSDRSETHALWLQASNFSIHPKYLGPTEDPVAFNVAIVHTPSPVKFTDYIRPICMPNSGYVGTSGTVAKGVIWSLRRAFSSLMNTRGIHYVKKEFPLIILENENCSIPNMEKDSHEICTESTDSIISHAFSGEPLIVKMREQHLLVGLSSRDSVNSLPRELETYLRLTSVVPWINSFKTGEMCHPPTNH